MLTDDEIRALRDLTSGRPEYCTRSLSDPKIAELCTRLLSAEARVKVLEEALRELADANFDEYCSDATESGEIPCTDDEAVSFGERPCSITFGMIRRARAALIQEQSK
jgi:hypothetical protein